MWISFSRSSRCRTAWCSRAGVPEDVPDAGGQQAIGVKPVVGAGNDAKLGKMLLDYVYRAHRVLNVRRSPPPALLRSRRAPFAGGRAGPHRRNRRKASRPMPSPAMFHGVGDTIIASRDAAVDSSRPRVVSTVRTSSPKKSRPPMARTTASPMPDAMASHEVELPVRRQRNEHQGRNHGHVLAKLTSKRLLTLGRGIFTALAQ